MKIGRSRSRTMSNSMALTGQPGSKDADRHEPTTKVIPLSEAPGEREAWNRSSSVMYLWAVAERLFVTNSWQPSSKLRNALLRLFGADIGEGVIFRPRTRVAFPWKLVIGANSWIGEGVWIHNQNHLTIGANAVISQDTFLTTGGHALRRDMALITSPIVIEDGVWVTSRCVVLGGTRIGTSAVIGPNSVVKGEIPPNTIWSGNPLAEHGTRFPVTLKEMGLS
jgi:putative colanic acid biosynthesis acetyltransferase WcaF